MPHNKIHMRPYLGVVVLFFTITASCWVFYAPACLLSGQAEGSVYTADGTFAREACYVNNALRPLSEQLDSSYEAEISVYLNQVTAIPFQIGGLVWLMIQITLVSVLFINNLSIMIYWTRLKPMAMALGILYCLLLWVFMSTLIGPQRGFVPYCMNGLLSARCAPPVYYVNRIEVVPSTVILAFLSTLGLVISLDFSRLWGNTAVPLSTFKETNMNENKQQSKACTVCYIALTLLLILIVICGILTLLGPQIGNVFSRIGDCVCL
jgi:hypothetical protein